MARGRRLRQCLYELLALYLLASRGELHGYELRRLIGEYTGSTPSESTVYDILRRLEKEGLVEGYWARSRLGPPRRYYRVTGKGLEALRETLEEARRLLAPLICSRGVEESDEGSPRDGEEGGEQRVEGKGRVNQ